MRVLYASERPPYPFFLGGAARSAHYLLSALAEEFSVDCLAVGARDFALSSPWASPHARDYAALGVTELSEDRDSIRTRCGYPIELSIDFPGHLRKTIEKFQPDVLWTQLDGADWIAKLARKQGIPTIFYLRDADSPSALLKSVSATGAYIVCNSRFLADHVRQITRSKTSFIYPSLDVAFEVVGDRHGYLTMINTHPVKGIDTFFAIAKALPEEKFLLVESWQLDTPALEALGKRLTEVPNVHFLHRVSDMRQVYGKTKLLLVPSVWEEAFGRVVIEAQSCRIPVIASARGGLPEAVGDGGICIHDFQNAAKWVETIRNTLADAAGFEVLAERAHAHGNSERFTQRSAARKFFETCSQIAGTDPSLLHRLRLWLGRIRQAFAN